MTEVALRPWDAGDLRLLERANEPEMTTHLVASETPAEVRARHRRYLALQERGDERMFAMEVDGETVGSIGWWDTTWRSVDVHETGWFVLPEAQRRRYATAALRLVIADAERRGTCAALMAFPSVANVASNRLCETSGFTLAATEDIEFRGATMAVNAWSVKLGDAFALSP
jgi:RimJ/RimL family protein N-acetyltransferase